METNSEVTYFARLVEALEPWLDQVVVIGGWAHRLYRAHPLAQTLDYEPLGTFDADVAVPSQLLPSAERIHDRLLDKGFKEDLKGDTQPPVVHYLVEAGDSGFYAEFLTPLVGSELKREGKRDITARISGISAQKLRYLELLLESPWEVFISPAIGYPTPSVRRVHVPNPAAFLVQKILIHEKRDHAKRAKDILYIHDTIETFGGNLAAIHDQWQSTVRPTLHENLLRQINCAGDKYFLAVNDTLRESARIATGRNLTPEMIREVCWYGWRQIFAASR